MKLLLIHAWNARERSYRGAFSNLFSYSSLTLAAICALIPEGMFEQVDVIDENSQKVQYDRTQYDLVMISFETSSSITAYGHCAQFRKRGAYVVCGGYHATALPDEVAEHCDTVIQGPAEHSIPAFLSDFAKGCPKPRYCDFDVCAAEFPLPVRDKITKRKKLRIPGIVANRGCMNACKYCSMRMMWRNDPRPVEQVVEEIRALGSKMVIFYDPNFFGNREYVLALMKALKPLKILWASNATADFGYDHVLMQAAYDSGCRGVLIGLESMNTQSLSGVGKQFYETDRYQEIIANIHSHGIAVNGCFVLGFDHDTEEELLALPERVERLGLDLCRFAILTPYPGTKQFEEYEKNGRILTKEWDRYTQHHAVFEPAQITTERLEEIYRTVWKKAYTWRRVFRRAWRSPWRGKLYYWILLGANIGFKFLGANKRKPK